MATYGEIKTKPARKQPGIITAFDLDGNTYAVRYYRSNVPSNAATEVGTPVIFEDVYYPNGWGVDGEFRLTKKRIIQRETPRIKVNISQNGLVWALDDPANNWCHEHWRPEFSMSIAPNGGLYATIPAYMWRGDERDPEAPPPMKHIIYNSDGERVEE